MNSDIYIENPKNNGDDSRLSEQFYQDCLATLGGSEGDAAMVLEPDL